jgi:hypothetical protein
VPTREAGPAAYPHLIGPSDATRRDDFPSRLPAVHVVGDAYASRLLVFATEQAHALAELLART